MMRSMKRPTLLISVMIAGMLLGSVPAVGASESHDGDHTVELIAGQEQVVGTVTVTNDDTKATVTYALDVEAVDAGWGIYETHLYVGATDEFPLTRPNRRLGGQFQANPIPGQFPYGDDQLPGVAEWSMSIALADLGVEFGDDVYVAAHAVVKRHTRGAVEDATIFGVGTTASPDATDPNAIDLSVIDPLENDTVAIFEDVGTAAGVEAGSQRSPSALAFDEDNRRLYFNLGQNGLHFLDVETRAVVNADPENRLINAGSVLGATFAARSYWYVPEGSDDLIEVLVGRDGIITEVSEPRQMGSEQPLTRGDIVYRDGVIYGSSGSAASSTSLRGLFAYNTADGEFSVLSADADHRGLQLAWGLDQDGRKTLFGHQTTDGTWYMIDLDRAQIDQVMTGDVPFVTYPYEDLASGFVYAQNWDSETAWGAGNRFNERGNWGTWFKYEIAEPTVAGPRNETFGPISLAFEDQRVDESDWDYNDWVVDIDTHGTFVGDDLTYLEFDITPLARGAANRHNFNLVLPAGTFGNGGDYTLEILDPNGAVLSTATRTLNETGDTDIRIWGATLDALPRMSNTGDGTVSEALQTARLSIEFDAGPNPFSFGDPDAMGIHGENLFFQPYLFNNSTGQNFAVEAGDIRMLAVPGGWRWPTERTRIWNAYEAVTESGGRPVFRAGWWDLGFNPQLVY